MKLAISGAGVAGPTLAYWLCRAGHEPTIIERAPQLRTGGYLIDFWGVGYRVAQRMGLESAIQAAGYQLESLRSVDVAGKTLARLPVDGFRRVCDGRLVSIARGDLAEILYGAVANDVETIFDEKITGIEQHPDGVSVTLARHAKREFDLVIGADGLHSNVRRLAFARTRDVEYYLGCMVAAAVVDGYRPREDLVYVTCSRPGRSVARFSLRGDRTLLLFVFRSDQCSEFDGLDGRKALLWREFGDAGWECKQMLAAMDEVDDVYFDTVSQIRMERWSNGRAALVGDAAACVSLLAGEGTGLAMAAAYVLAGELMCAQGDHRRAFSAYERQMRHFVTGKQAGAQKLLPVFATETELGLRIRHLVMKAMSVRPLFDLIVSRSLRDDFDLPDCPM